MKFSETVNFDFFTLKKLCMLSVIMLTDLRIRIVLTDI